MFKKYFQLSNEKIDNKSAKRILQKEISELLKPTYFEQIPLGKIFDVFKKYNIYATQEDGTEWSGMLMGGADCGSNKAQDQRATFDLASKDRFGKLSPINLAFYMTWCKMPSGKYEVIGYVS